MVPKQTAYQQELHSGLEVVPPDAPQVYIPQASSDPASAPQLVTSDQKYEAPHLASVNEKRDYHQTYTGAVSPDQEPNKAYLGTPRDAESAAADGGKKGKIMGLRRRTFWIVLVILVLVIGGAVGGGIGATVGKSNASGSSSSDKDAIVNGGSSSSSSSSRGSPSTSAPATSTTSPTTTTASTSAALSSPTYVANAQEIVSGCPGVNNTIYTASTGRDRFLKVCALEMPGPAIDITSYSTPTFDACIDKCAQLNFDNNNSTCLAVTWDLRNYDGNYKLCYLKKAIGAWRTQGSPDSYLVTGLLIGR